MSRLTAVGVKLVPAGPFGMNITAVFPAGVQTLTSYHCSIYENNTVIVH